MALKVLFWTTTPVIPNTIPALTANTGKWEYKSLIFIP